MPCETVCLDLLLRTSSSTLVSDCSISLKETKEKVEIETMDMVQTRSRKRV